MNNFDLKKFFNFDIFVSINIIKVLYFLTFVAISLVSVYLPFSMGFRRQSSYWGGPSDYVFSPSGLAVGIFSALALFIVGHLATRIYYELLIVVLKINENLQKLVDESATGVLPKVTLKTKRPVTQQYVQPPQPSSIQVIDVTPKVAPSGKHCPKCLAELKGGAVFCEDCGQRV